MNKEQLKQYLPHRSSMLLLDDAEVVTDENGVQTAHARKTFTGTEWFFDGHFPENPVVPGVIQCEILAQTVCVLLEPCGRSVTPYFTGMKEVRWKRPVRPGETLETVCTVTRAKKPFYFAKGEGYVNGALCVSAEFSFAIMENAESNVVPTQQNG